MLNEWSHSDSSYSSLIQRQIFDLRPDLIEEGNQISSTCFFPLLASTLYSVILQSPRSSWARFPASKPPRPSSFFKRLNFEIAQADFLPAAPPHSMTVTPPEEKVIQVTGIWSSPMRQIQIEGKRPRILNNGIVGFLIIWLMPKPDRPQRLSSLPLIC